MGYLKDLFIDEAKPALRRHSGSGLASGKLICFSSEPSGSNELSGLSGNFSISYPNARSVDDFAFEACSFTAIDLPKVTSVGNSAFLCCDSLTAVNLPKATSIDYMAFDGCVLLTAIDLPNVTSVGDSAFGTCEALTAVNLPKVTSIGYSAFSGCTSLTAIDLHNVTSVADNTFNGCASLVTIDLSNAITIDFCAFEDCTSLTVIDLPKVTSIGYSAFRGCTSLTALILSNAETVCDIASDALISSRIMTEELVPTGEGFIYVPTHFYEGYVANMLPQVTKVVDDATVAEQMVRAIFRKIEDYPEICG